MFWTLLFLIFGFLLLLKSADVFVDGAAGVAKRFNVPKAVIGLTLVAFGTSVPEMTVSIISAFQHNADLTVGNIIGSNIANIALILGLAASFKALPVLRSTASRGIPLNILAAATFIILGYDKIFQNHEVTFNRFSLGDGLILLSFFIIFLYYIYGHFKAAEAQEEVIEKKEQIHKKDPFPKLILFILGGLAGVLVGGKLVVDNAVLIARYFHLSEAFIGLTLVAIGTSLPELITSVVAAMKKESDIAIGNIVGSNIFNIFLVLGSTALIHPINFDPKLLIDALFMLFLSILFFFLVIRKKQLTRTGGFVLLSCYVVYLIFLGARDFVLAFFIS